MLKFNNQVLKVIYTCCFALFCQTLLALPAPYLSTPSTGITLNRFEAFLSVQQVTGATGYEIQYDTVTGFNSPHLRSDTTSLQYLYTQELRMGATYYWRARAFKPGDTSSWSGYRNFTVYSSMELLSPKNNTTGNMVGLQCTNSSTFIPVTYFFEADSVPDFNSPLHIQKTFSENVLIDTPLMRFGGKIYWRARASNIIGDTLNWSETWLYTMDSRPSVNQGFSNSSPETRISWPTLNLSEPLIQVDTSATFNSAALSEKLLARGVTADTLRDLLFGQKYYYRLRAKFDTSLSEWSDPKSLVVSANGNISSPSYNGQTINELITSFSWTNLKGAYTQCQLSRDSNFAQLMKDTSIYSSYSFNYPDTLSLNTKYYVRIRYYHSKDTTPWLTRVFQTFGGAVSLSGPFNSEQNIAVRPQFTFRQQPWATGYVLEIDTGTAFGPVPSPFFIRINTFVYNQAVLNASADTSLLYGQSYVWRVYAIKGADTAASSNVNRFTTKAVPVNYFPPDHTIGVGTSTDALVTGIPGSTYIEWELDTSLSFQSGEHFSGISPHVADEFSPAYIGLSWPPNLLFESTYYWRTRCINPVDTSPWSAAFNFNTTEPPFLKEPANNAVNLDPTADIVLKWSIQGSASDYIYQYQLGTDPSFTNTPVINLPAGESPEVNVQCAFEIRYYWRARATHPRDTSVWSPVFSFTTLDTPYLYPPTLMQPFNRLTNVPVEPVLMQWTSVALAKGYDIQVASDTFFNQVLTSGSAEGNVISFSGVQPRSRYYWRVRGKINTLLGQWSHTWWFETGNLTGINETSADMLFSMKPNPANDEVYIESVTPCMMMIYDQTGACVYRDENPLKVRQINIRSWNRGIYHVVLSNAAGTVGKRLVLGD